MNSDQKHLLLLSDALDRVVRSPGASHCWRNLMQFVLDLTRPDILEKVIQALVKAVPAQGLTGFYLASFLEMATGDTAYAAKAIGFLKTITPQDPDRLLAFFHVSWQKGLLYADDRPAFLQALVSSDLPDLAACIDQSLAGHVKPVPRSRVINRVRKVAIIAPQLTRLAHPPTRMALDQAEIFIQHDIAVNLFSCQETNVPDFLHLLGTGADNAVEEAQLDDWVAGRGASVKIFTSDQRFSVLRRWLDMLRNIDIWEPDLVMFVGLHSGLIGTLYKKYPVLALGSNSIAPLVPNDIWLTAQESMAGPASRPWGEHLPESQAWLHPYRVRRKVPNRMLSRSSLHLSETAIVLISVGNHLERPIQGPWAERMCAVVAGHPDLVWLIVGGTGIMPSALQNVSQEKLRLIAHTSQVLDIIAESDIYVNPPMMGGGFAVAEAMSLAVPVLAFADADGGDKIGAAAVTGMDAYFERLEVLIVDRAERQCTGQEMQRRFDTELDLERSGPSLLGACALALQRFQQRTQAV